MTALLPDWILVVSTMLALAVFVTGRARLAALLATPALLRFLFWPAVMVVMSGIPVFVLIMMGILALPVIAVRAARQILILFVGAEAADHALGYALGAAIIRLFGGRRQ